MNWFLSFLVHFLCEESDAQTKQLVVRWNNDSWYVFSCRLNIPPFVCARTVLEDLESEGSWENKIPVKAEAPDTKVTRHKPQTSTFLITGRSRRMICDGFVFTLSTRGQAERNRWGWKRKRPTCSRCVTPFLWRFWIWVGSVSVTQRPCTVCWKVVRLTFLF